MRRPWFLVLWLVCLCSALAAQSVPDERAETELELAARSVFRFRAERSGYTPEQRRTAAAALLAELLEREGDGRVTRRATADGEMLLLDGFEVLSVLAADVDSLAGLRQEVLSRLHGNVLDDFEAAGVQILSPHHTHLHGAVGATSAPRAPLR